MQAIECKRRALLGNNSFFGEFSDCRMPVKTGSLSQTPPHDKYPMVNTLGILTAIVLAFSAFVALKNKELFEKAVIDTEQQAKNRDRN